MFFSISVSHLVYFLKPGQYVVVYVIFGVAMSHSRLPDLVNKNAGCPPEFKFQVNNKYFFSISVSHIYYILKSFY